MGAWQHPFRIVMAGLVPAIHVLANRKQRHGCPGQARAWRVCAGEV